MSRLLPKLPAGFAGLLIALAAFQATVPNRAAAQPEADRTAACVAVLEAPTSSREARFEACRQLAAGGDARAVPALAGLLDNDELAHMARYALESIPGPEADAALRTALGRVKGPRLVGVIDSVGQRGDAEAIPALGRLAALPDSDAADAAAGALARIGTPAAANALKPLLATAPGTAPRPASADACLRCAEGLARKGNDAPALELYRALAGSRAPERHILAATRGVILLSGAEGVPPLVALLDSESPARRALALRLAREVPEGELLKALAAKLPELPAETQVALLGALVDREDATAMAAVSAAAGSKAPEARVAAIRALGTFGDAGCIPLLIAAAGKTANADESAAALEALRLLPAAETDAAVAAALPDAAPALRVSLMELLQSRAAVAAVPALLVQTRADDAAVRAAAFVALGALARTEDLPAMVDSLLACPDEQGREAAIRAVSATAAKLDDPAHRADAVTAALARTTDPARRCLLLQALGRIGNFAAFDGLRSALTDPEPTVSETAFRALASWPDATPAALLLELAATDNNPVRRALALRAAIRMAGLVAADCERPSSQVLAWFAEIGRIVRSDDEKKLLLAGLSSLPHKSALDRALSYLGEEAIRAEAGLAVVRLSGLLANLGYRGAAEGALKQVIETVPDAAVRQQAEAALNAMNQSTEYIVTWQICGPYMEAGKECQQLYPVVFPPEQAGAPGDWRLLERFVDPTGRMTRVDPILAGSHRAAYVRTWLVSPTEQAARLEFGFDDGGKAWLNDQVICEANTAGACVPGAHKADVRLREGRNLLFLKITQHTGPWQFSVRLAGPDGAPLPGVTVSAGSAPEAAPDTAAAPTPAETDFSRIPAVPIFDGKTLDGWEGAPGCFRVRDGAIVGGQLEAPITVSDYLCTTKAYGDFELTAEVRTRGVQTNGGIQFRGARIPNSHAMSGYQADVCDGAYWGSLYDCYRNGFAADVPQKELTHVLRIGDWNEYRIQAVGSRIRIWLNGYMTVDWTEADPAIPKTGVFGLQSHQGPPGEGWYRNMMIRELN